MKKMKLIPIIKEPTLDLHVYVSSFTDNKITVRINEHDYILELNPQEILKLMNWLVGQTQYSNQQPILFRE